MPEEVGFSVRRSSEICVSKHHEEEAFGQVAQHCDVYRHEIRVSSEGVGLELHRIYVISGIYILQGMRMRQLDGRRWVNMSHAHLFVQKLEDRLGVALGNEDVKIPRGFLELNLELYPRQK